MKSEEKARSKKEVLFEAALEEFSEKSYDDASLNDILKRASVSKGAFYYSFTDKKDLYVQLYNRLTMAKADFFASLTKGEGDQELPEAMTQPDQVNVFKFIQGLTVQGLGFTKAHPEFFRFVSMFTKESEEFRKSVEGNQAIDVTSYIQGMVIKAYDNGDIDEKYPLDFAVKLLTFTLTNYLDIIGFSDVDDMDKAFEELKLYYEFLERGLSPLAD